MASSAQLQSQQQQQQQRRRCLPSSSSSSSPAWNSSGNKDWNATTRSRVTTVDFLMDETDARIAAAEYEHASNFLVKALAMNNNNSSSNGGHSAEAEYDEADADADAEAEVKAEAAFRSACLAASRGDAEAALVLCESALKQCPPQRTSALAKINKLAKRLSLRHRPKAPPPPPPSPPADVAVPNPCSASVDAVSVSSAVHSEEPNRLRSGI